MTDADYIARLLDAERAVQRPSDSAEQGMQRLLDAVAAHAAPLPVAAGTLKLGWSLAAKWVGVGFVVGTAGAGAASFVSNEAVSPPAPIATASTMRPAPAPEMAHAVAAATVELDPPAVSSVSTARSATPGVTPAPLALPTPTTVASASSTFDEELRVISAAKRELDAGRPHLASVWLSEHRQRFPRGVFVLEREGLRVLASCATEPNPTLARTFANQHPESAMLPQILRRCSADAPPPATSGSFLEGDK